MFSLIIFSLFCKYCYRRLSIVFWLPSALIISFAPIYAGHTSQYYLTAIFAQLSITSIILYGYWLFGIQSSRNQNKFLQLSIAIIIFSLPLYYSTLFNHSIDLYYYGFSHLYFLIAITLFIIISLFFNYWFVFWVIFLGLIAFNLKLLDSNNLWNYYIDPLLIIVLIITLIKGFTKNLLNFTISKESSKKHL